MSSATGIVRLSLFPRILILALFVVSLLALGLVLGGRDSRATAPIPSITGFLPASGYPGVPVTITGVGLSTVTGVAFNGTAALCWTIDSSTQITAVVPRGAASGPISLTTLGPTVDSTEAFTVTPNGPGRITVTSQVGDYRQIFVMNADGTRMAQLTDGENSRSASHFSPDGTRIVYQWYVGDSWEIGIMNADGSGQTRLTNTAGAEMYPVFSPDGRQIAFASDRDGVWEIYVMNADGSGVRRLTTNTSDEYCPAFSPDGKKIVFMSDRHFGGGLYNEDLYLVNAADGSGEVRLTTDGGRDSYPCFSPDGSHIAFASSRWGSWGIFTMRADGSEQTPVVGPVYGWDSCMYPSYSPDGTRIAFNSSLSLGDQLWTVNADGTGRKRITSSEQQVEMPSWCGGPLLTPYVAALSPAYGYPGVPVTISGSSLAGATEVTFNGTPAICFTVDSDSQITAVIPFGATTGPVAVTTPVGSGSSATPCTVVAPGPGWIVGRAEMETYDIYRWSPDGERSSPLSGDQGAEDEPAFSPDGRRIAFVSDRDGNDEIYLMDADGNGETRLTNTPGAADYRPAFSPDGRKIAFVSDRDGSGQIYLMNADGSGQTRLTADTADNDMPAFSHDGETIFFSSNRDGNQEIYAMNRDGSGLTRLTDNPASDVSPAMSPDGTCIAFASNRDGNYEIYLLTSGGTTRLTTDPADDTAPCFSPDGTQIAFTSTRDGRNAIYRMNVDGSAQTRVAMSSSRGACNPSWGGGANPPEFTEVVPAAGHPGQVVTIRGTNFVDVRAVRFNYTPALCWTEDSPTQITAVVPFGALSGPVSVVTAAGYFSTGTFTVLPAGPGTIAFLDDSLGCQDIFTIHPDGSARTRQTADYESREDLAISPDSTRIVCSMYNQVYIINADGTDNERLTIEGSNAHPRFSPDGRRIVYTYKGDGEPDNALYVMNADGSGKTLVFDLPGNFIDPVFTPDGRAIVFAHSDTASTPRVFRVNLDGSGLTELATGVSAYWLDCAPDGSIIFCTNPAAGIARIGRMNADGTGLEPLTDGTYSDVYPHFSPDGSQIVFSRYDGTQCDLYVMNADGSGQTRITETTVSETIPCWGGGPSLQPLSGLTLYPDPANPAPTIGSQQTIVAQAIDGICPEFSYTVTLKDILADFSHTERTIVATTPFALSPYCTFSPTEPGRYAVTVTARERGTTDPIYTQTFNCGVGSDHFYGVSSFTADQPSSLTLDAIPAGGITLSAAVAGDGVGVQYYFTGTLRTVAADGTATNVPVTLSTAWGGNTFAWKPTAPGYYTLRVIAADDTYNTQGSAYLTFLVRDPSLTGLSFTASPASGTPLNRLPAGGVTLTGVPIGTGVGVQYFFAGVRTALPDGTSVNEPIAISTAWSTAATSSWLPATAGTYLLSLTARDASGNTAITKKLTYRVGLPRITGVTLTADPPSGVLETNVPAGGILLTAAPVPAEAGAEYFFAAKLRTYRADGTYTDTPVTLSTAYATDPTFAWQPATPGMYVVTVSARDLRYGGIATRAVNYQVKPASLAGIASLTAAPPSGTVDTAVPAGGIILTATPQGSGAGAEYFFSAKLKDVAADGSVTVVPITLSAAWSADPTCAWTPTVPGSYTLTVKARDVACQVTVSKNVVYLLKSDTLTGLTAFTPGVPSGAVLGSLPPGGVPFTAAIAGTGTGVQYRYQVGKSNGTSYVYEPLTDYTTSNVFTFAPVTPGAYRLWVFACDATYNTSYSRYSTYVVK